MRKNIAAILCVGALALSANGAHASFGSSFTKCLRTPLAHFEGTIVEAAVKTPALSTLVTAVQAADLVDALSGEGPLTVYAPTNDAFGKIPAVLLEALLADPELLASVLTYHVTSGEVDPRRSFIPQEVSTLQGQTVFFNRGKDGSQVNQSNINCTGVQTTNGIVWIIDSVLLPQF
jgi:uncharacterized surface protein with fasciclin (FAS1) repeats